MYLKPIVGGFNRRAKLVDFGKVCAKSNTKIQIKYKCFKFKPFKQTIYSKGLAV